jgi:hypothetical protein
MACTLLEGAVTRPLAAYPQLNPLLWGALQALELLEPNEEAEKPLLANREIILRVSRL